MPDEKSVGQEPIDAGQEPVTEVTEKGATVAGQEPEEERFDAEYVRGLRREAAEYRKRLRELEAKAKADEDAKLTETERLQAKVAEYERLHADHERERQEWALRRAVDTTAAKLGIIDADAAYKLLDLAKLEFAESGAPRNLDRVLSELVSQRPYLVGGSGTSATNPARQTTLTMDTIRRMTPEEINTNWEAVQAALARSK